MNSKSEEKHVLLGEYFLSRLRDKTAKVPAARMASDLGLFAAGRASDRVAVIQYLIETYYPQTLEVEDGDVVLRHGQVLDDLQAAIETAKKKT